MGADARSPVACGDVIDGRFRVERVLGRGGMGVVVQAMHLQLREPVAIKLLRPEIAQDEQTRRRFLREARASARLRSEHVVRLMDFGLYETGSPIIVMEYLEGSDLGAVLARGPLSIEDTVDFVLQATEGIAEAHAHGMVHRDLKPANLFVSLAADGSTLVKVLDFGVSKLARDADDPLVSKRITEDHALLGSPAYMSPEQLTGEATDARADIWALGVILFECLTGRLPFEGRTAPELFAKILAVDPTPIRELREDAPACLEALVASCLTKDVAKRCADSATFASELVKAAPAPTRSVLVARITRMRDVASRLPVEQSSADPAEEGTVTEWRRTRRLTTISTRRWKPAFGIAVVAVAAGTGMFLWERASRLQTTIAPSASLSGPRGPVPSANEDSPNTLSASAPMGTASTSNPEPLPPASTDLAASTSASTVPPAAPVRLAVPARSPAPTTTRPATKKRDPLDGWEPLDDYK